MGGSDSVINRAQDYLTPLSNNQFHFGDIRSGTAYKLIVNLMGSIQIAATAEALPVAGEHEKEIVFDALWRLKDTKYGVNFAKAPFKNN